MNDEPQKIKSYKELIVWQKAVDLVDAIYTIVDEFPKLELYILTSQMLRAAISIPSNIAEGYRRTSKAEYLHFLSIAIASAGEPETQLIIAKRRYNNIDYIRAETLVDEVRRMVYVMIKRLAVSPLSPVPSTL